MWATITVVHHRPAYVTKNIQPGAGIIVRNVMYTFLQPGLGMLKQTKVIMQGVSLQRLHSWDRDALLEIQMWNMLQE